MTESRRNIALVEPRERALLRDAFIELNKTRFYPGNRNDTPLAGGVSEWFKQDEIHQSTHVHDGPMFLPWHRELVNRFEDLLRGVNSDLSLHYWDWTQDPEQYLTRTWVMVILGHLICLLQSLWGMVATKEHQSVSHGGEMITFLMLTTIGTTRETLRSSK